MGIAVLTLSNLFAPLLVLLSRLTHRPSARNDINYIAKNRQSTGANRVFLSKNATPGPVRVIRLAETGGRPDVAGRMVISGRMADVCAELDRLEQHAARHTRS